MDLLLDPTTHDIVWTNGAIDVTYTPQEVVSQRLKIALWTFLGEWFLDAEVGTPYFQQILGKGRRQETVDAIFQDIILSDEDVVEILAYNSDMRADRTFTLSFQVRCVDGFVTDTIEIDTFGV